MLLMNGADDSTSREVRFTINQDGDQSDLVTADADLALNTTYFITASWDQPNNSRRVRVYNSSGTLITGVEDTSTPFTAPADLGGTDRMLFGEVAGVTAAYYIDNIFIGDGYPDADTFLTYRNITSYTQYGVNSVNAKLVKTFVA
jgi:hypothetical protein